MTWSSGRGVDPSALLLGFERARRLTLEPGGDLILSTGQGRSRQRRPRIYQDIDGRIVLRRGGYVKRGEDAIGRSLDYATYLGGGGNETGSSIAVDASGQAHLTGLTTSSDFPLTNALQTTRRGPSDVFITKLTADGSAKLYSTYLGGGGIDTGLGIAVDALDQAHLTGQTTSSDFPRANALQTSRRGPSDAFVTKLSSDGQALLYSTYLGGDGIDGGAGIGVDPLGRAHVAGWTRSSDFPLAEALQAARRGREDAFLTTLSPEGDTPLFSTYLGGGGTSEIERAHGIALDAGGAVYLAGTTSSLDFPRVTPFQGALGGGTDAFLAKIRFNGAPAITSTPVGEATVGELYRYDVEAIDPDGDGVLTCYTYDVLGRVTSETSPDRGGITYSYDLANNLTRMTDARGITVLYSYDALDRMISLRYPDPGEDVTYTYDTCPFGIGRLCGRIDESGQYAYAYDAFGNVIEMIRTELGIPHTTSYQYDEGDRIIAMTLPTGRALTYTRDGLRRIERIETPIDGTPTPVRAASTYQADNQITSRTYGNALIETLQRGSTPPPAAQPNREYHYNQAGRLAEVIENGLLQARYTYNAEGQRTRKVPYSGGTLPTGTTLYHYDLGGRLLAETTEDGTPLRDYLWHDDEPFVQIDTAGGFETLLYLHTDHLKTPRLATGTSGAILWRWEGEAFGSAAPELANATINLRFPGQYFDAETGLHYNYFRDYDPSIGRYVQSDPIGLDGGINTYAYVGSNPLTRIDPTGEIVFVLPAIPAAITALGEAAAYVGSAALAGYLLSEIVGDDAAPSDDANDDADNENNCPPEKYPLKNRERRNKERREKPKDPVERERRQRENEDTKRRSGRGGRDPTPTGDDW